MNLPFDLDDEELKATRKLNGADKEQYKNLETLKELWNAKVLYIVDEGKSVPASLQDIDDYLKQNIKKKGKHE